MLAPREDVADGLTPQPLDADAAVALDAAETASDERLQLLGGEMDRRAFHDPSTCISRASSVPGGPERRHVRRDVEHVVAAHLVDDGLHQRHPRTFAQALL